MANAASDLERVACGLRASRDRRGERDADIIRDLAVEGLQALERIRDALAGMEQPSDAGAVSLFHQPSRRHG